MTPDKLPQSPEQEVSLPHVDKANDYMADMANHEHNSDEAFTSTEQFIDSILPPKVEPSDGEQQESDREALIDRFAIYIDEMNKLPEDRKLADPLKVFTRKDGLRASVEAVMGNHDTKIGFTQQMMLRIEELDKERDAAERLRSASNMHKVGGAELDAAEVIEPIPGAGDPLAEAARAASGIIDKIPSSIQSPIEIPLPPPFEAMAAVAPAEAALNQEPGQETELEMYERFIREASADVNALYAELRAEESKPVHMRDANEIARIGRDIKYSKGLKDEYYHKAGRLKGDTKWTRGGS